MEQNSTKCELALELKTRQLMGDASIDAERLSAENHISGCADCQTNLEAIREADALLKEGYASAAVAPEFASRVMAMLPRSPKVAETGAAQAKVFSVVAPRRSWALRTLAVASLIALIAGMAVLSQAPKKVWVVKNGIAFKGGEVVDASGAPARELKPGVVYTVKTDTVVPLTEHGTLKIKEGTEFQVELSAGNEPQLRLAGGDLYAWGRDGSEQKPLRVSCSSFETTLQAGDFYVAEDSAEQTSSVVIVFRGNAQVTRGAGVLPLREGQVFFVLEGENEAFAHTIELNDALLRLRDDPPAAQADMASMRRVYQKQINGYQKELARLESLLKAEKDAQLVADLQERQQLVHTYLDAHQRKLKTLWREFPYEEIERGLHGHSDPATWM